MHGRTVTRRLPNPNDLKAEFIAARERKSHAERFARRSLDEINDRRNRRVRLVRFADL